MLLGEPQQLVEPLVFPLERVRAAHVLLHGNDLLFQLLVLRLEGFVAEHIVIVPLHLPHQGAARGAEGGQRRLHQGLPRPIFVHGPDNGDQHRHQGGSHDQPFGLSG